MAVCCEIDVECGVDLEAGLVHLVCTELPFEFAAHLFDEPGRDAVGRGGDTQAQRRGFGGAGLRGGDGAVFEHGVDHQVAAAEGLLRIEQRGVGDRPLGQAGEQRSFGQGELARVFAEVEGGACLEAEDAVAEIDLVRVEGEYLLLGERALDLDGEEDLLQLPAEGAVAREKQVARQLHGEGGGALGAAARGQVVIRRAGDAEYVDAPVALEVLVLDGEDGLAQHGREGGVGHDGAAFECKGAEGTAVHVVEIRGGEGTVVLEVLDLRQIDGVDKQEPGSRSQPQPRAGGAPATRRCPPACAVPGEVAAEQAVGNRCA